MTISYPLLLPTSVGISDITISPHNVVAVSASPFTLKSNTYQHQGQAWVANVTVGRVHRDLAAPWVGFLAALNSSVGTFYLGDPNAAFPLGSVSGNVLVDGADQTGSSLNVKGMTGGSAFEAGDYIQLGSGVNSRLYMVVEKAGANDDTGLATLNIWPSIITAPSDGATVIYNNASGVFRLASAPSYNINQISTYGITFDCVSVVP